MANYQLLKADIDAKVYQNGNQKITGQILNSVLNAMVTTLGAEYQFAGVATTATNPGTPDAKVFYIANGKGTYTNFGGLEVTEDDVVVLTWDSSWHKVSTEIASQAKLSELESQIGTQKGLSTDIDIDNLPNGILSFTATSVPSGMPNIDYGAGATIITTRATKNTPNNFDRQTIITPKAFATRAYFQGSWAKWETSDIDAGGKFVQKGRSTDIDIDNLPNGIVSFTAASVPSGMPNIDYGAGATIITTRATKNTPNNFDRQTIITPKAFATRAYFQGSWAKWEIYNLQDNIIHCGQGQKYTRLRDAVAAAIEVENTKVVIHPGTYNLAEEFAEEIANQNGTGIVLHNGVHLLFMSGSYVTCEIDVSNEWAYSNFEPFSAYKDFTLENAHIICRNTRYCVHDELNGASTYHHRYINCHMEYTNEHESANFTQCIGGGMGEHGYIEIIGGYYKSFSNYYQSHYASADDMQQPITFHNGANATCDGKIVIKDVFLADKGYFRFGMYGSSSKKTPIYISGCRMYKAPFLMNEQWNDSQVQNMEVIAWNNEIVI